MRWHGDGGLLPAAVRPWLEEALIASAAAAGVCVLVKGDAADIATFGERVLDSAEPVSPEHAFPVASLAKAAAALVVAQLADQGRLDVDAPARAWLPECPLPAAVTLRHLLANASGLAPVWPLDEMLGAHLPTDTVLRRMAALPAVACPGERFEYLNLGFVAAARAAERAADRPYAELLHSGVFSPLGMTGSASVPRWSQLGPRLVAAHGGTPMRVLDSSGAAPYNNHQGAGWLAMSGTDAVRWMQAWLGSAKPDAALPLSSAAQRQCLTPVVPIKPADAGLWIAPPTAQSAGYGWGWAHARWQGFDLVQHSGASIGCTAHITMVPQQRLGIATFLSGGRLYRAALHYALLETLLPIPQVLGPAAWLRRGEEALAAIEAPEQPLPHEAQQPQADIAGVLGRWFARGAGAATVALADEHTLWLDFDDAPHWRCRLYPRGGRAWATELVEPNDGLRFMAARPLGRFEPACGHARRFVHPAIEPLERLAA